MPTESFPLDRRGFTLVEVLVSLLILGVFAMVAGLVFQGALRVDTLLEADRQHLRETERTRVRVITDQEEGWEALRARVLEQQEED